MPSAKVGTFKDEPVVIQAPRVWSSMQVAIFNWFSGERKKKHLYIRARAGSSKTTSILEGINRAPEDNILLCAFNKVIADTLSERLTNPRAHAQTLHSLGYRAIRQYGDAAFSRVCEKRFAREDWLAEQVSGGLPWGGKRLVAKLTTKARELEPIGATVESLTELAMDFDLMPSVESDLNIQQVARAVLEAMELAKQPPHESGIDYADMVYLPLAMGWLEPQFDMVVVDEAQDMTRAQMLIAQRVLKSYGCIVLVADPAQSIYSFRGADCANLAKLSAELDAEELPLTVSYRCPRLVVQLAQKLVPDFQAHDAAPDGIVDSIDSLDELIKVVECWDFILSRKNAPLARIAMALLRAKKRVKVQGRDIGTGLRALVKRLARGKAEHSIPVFLQKLGSWEEREITRLVAMKHEEKVAVVEDRAATIRALAMDADSVSGLDARIDYLFTDNGEGSIICGTVHRLKGMEAGRVFIVRSTFFLRVPCVCGHRHKKACRCGCEGYTPEPIAAQEEVNLMYVAQTRAMNHLTFLEEVM